MLTTEQIARLRARLKDTSTGEEGLSDLWNDICPVLDEILEGAEAFANICWFSSHPEPTKYEHEFEGIYSFPRVVLQPNVRCVVPLILSLPFQLSTLVSSPENTSGLVIEKILVGDRNLITSGKEMPIEMFLDGTSPVRLDDPSVPIGVALKLSVRNDSVVERILSIAARGIALSNMSREERAERLQHTRLRRRTGDLG